MPFCFGRYSIEERAAQFPLADWTWRAQDQQVGVGELYTGFYCAQVRVILVMVSGCPLATWHVTK